MIVPKPPPEPIVVSNPETNQHGANQRSRISWARPLKLVFNIDIESCDCGGKLKILAAIEDPKVIKKILDHL